jgi:hypothetical protein
LALSSAAVVPATVVESDVAPALERRTVVRLAVLLACLAVAIGAVGTWAVAISEGGVLGPIDYLWQTFGLFIPAELIVASLAAAWGASSGPLAGR